MDMNSPLGGKSLGGMALARKRLMMVFEGSKTRGSNPRHPPKVLLGGFVRLFLSLCLKPDGQS